MRSFEWIALPGLTHLYVDTVWTEVGKELDCLHYCPEVILEHMHWSNHKSKRDDTYVRNDHEGQPYLERDRQCYEAWDRQEIETAKREKELHHVS